MIKYIFIIFFVFKNILLSVLLSASVKSFGVPCMKYILYVCSFNINVPIQHNFEPSYKNVAEAFKPSAFILNAGRRDVRSLWGSKKKNKREKEGYPVRQTDRQTDRQKQ